MQFWLILIDFTLLCIQKVAEAISRSIESIQQGTLNDAEDALRSADKALAICLYSEKLLEIKAKALFLVRLYMYIYF